MNIQGKQLVITAAVLMILTGITCGTATRIAAAESSGQASAKAERADIAGMMASMNFQQPAQPVSPPDFQLMSLSEEQHRLRDYRGKVVLLSFWATW